MTRHRINILAVLTLLAGAAALLDGTALSARVARCSGVAVTPSSDIQGLIDSSPAGMTFCFAAGTYGNASQLEPKSGDVFDGDGQQAVLDGGNSAQWAFYGDARSIGPSGVTIRDFTIQHYASPLQRGAIQDYNGANWIIQDNNITSNAAAAVATGDYVKVLGNKLDENQQEGFSAHGTGGLYEGNDISNNDTALNSDPSNGLWADWEAGGGKAFFTTNLTFKDNTVDNNGGNGLWADTNNIYTTYIGNTVDNNSGAGIYEEQSYDFTITGNTVTRNGMPSSPGGGSKAGYAFAAGIQVRRSGALSGDTAVISGNTVANNYNGITLIESPPTVDCGPDGCRYFTWRVQNVTVRDNGVTMTQGATGAWEDGEGDQVFNSNNNHFTGNSYCVSSDTQRNDGYTYGWFGWLDGWPSFSSWQGYGNDTRGTYVVTSSQCSPPGGGGNGGGGLAYDATGSTAMPSGRPASMSSRLSAASASSVTTARDLACSVVCGGPLEYLRRQRDPRPVHSPRVSADFRSS